MDKICFIRCYKSEGDYISDGFKKLGYQIYIPYKDTNLFRRLIREFWFRLHLPGKKIFFNKKLLKVDSEVFVVSDPLMCKQFLYWLKDTHPNSRICLNYENRVNKTFNPELVDSNVIEKWSYDKDDCEKYHMNFVHAALVESYMFDARENNNLEYDVLFLGRDKNRLGYLQDLENKLKEKNLKTYFYICADRSYLKFKNKKYKPLMSYTDYLELVKKSRAILNIMPDGQTSITQREIESAFYNIKCITNNKGVLTSDLYDKSRYFVLGVDDFENIDKFLKEPLKPAPKEIIDRYTIKTYAKTFIENKPVKE